jgi:hypothetical protein
MNVKHLMAMRTQLDAVQIQLDAMIEEQINAESVKEKEGCQHKNAVDVSTMGEPRKFFCKDCGITKEYEVSEQDGATNTCG